MVQVKRESSDGGSRRKEYPQEKQWVSLGMAASGSASGSWYFPCCFSTTLQLLFGAEDVAKCCV